MICCSRFVKIIAWSAFSFVVWLFKFNYFSLHYLVYITSIDHTQSCSKELHFRLLTEIAEGEFSAELLNGILTYYVVYTCVYRNLHVIHSIAQNNSDIILTIDVNYWNWVFKCFMRFPIVYLNVMLSLIMRWSFATGFWIVWKMFHNLRVMHGFSSLFYLLMFISFEYFLIPEISNFA